MSRARPLNCAPAAVLVCALVAAALALGGCSKDDPGTVPGDGGPRDSVKPGDAGEPDLSICRRPPLSLCEPPGTNPACPTKWFCPGCVCEGALSAAACNPLNGDCRWFCNGCYPQEYFSCADQSAPITVLGQCGLCFSDAGLDQCDKLTLDSQGGPIDAGGGG